MPRSAAANEQIRQAQRARILRAAREVFSNRGWDATMADIAVQAGVSQGLAYRYFSGKEALLSALVEQATREAPLPPAADVSGSPGQRLERLIRATLRARQERPHMFRIVQHALADPAMPDRFRELARAQSRAFRERLDELIREGQRTGEVAPDDPAQLIAAVTALLTGLTHPMNAGSELAPRHFPDAEIVLRLVRAPTPSPDMGDPDPNQDRVTP